MHKHLFLLFFLFMSGLIPLYAQDSVSYGKYQNHPDYAEGIITDAEGNRMKGLIKTARPESLYRKLHFVNAEGKKKKYRPDDLLSFQLGKSVYHSDGKLFLELVEAGEQANLYRKRKSQSAYVPVRPAYSRFPGPPARVYTGENQEITYFVRKKGESRFRQVEKSGFHRAYAAYFADCPKLAERIRAKELDYSHIKIILQIYNNHCNS